MQAALRRKLTVFTLPQPEGFPDLAQEEAMSTARTVAYEEGYRAGRLEAEQEAQDTKAKLDQTVSELAAQLNQIVQEIEASHQRSIVQLMQAALPKLAKSAASEEIMDIVLKAAGASLQGGLAITAHPSMAAQLGAHLDQVSLVPPINIIPETECDELAVKLSWQGGGAELDVAAAVQDCLAVLQPHCENNNGEMSHGE